VVATAAPGTTEVVVDGETGRLLPIGDIRSMARVLRDLIRDPATRNRMGKAGRARVESNFQADTMISQFAELYERLAAQKKRG
jgi:glycosyltransferase involved in cell wall biosynthesis